MPLGDSDHSRGLRRSRNGTPISGSRRSYSLSLEKVLSISTASPNAFCFHSEDRIFATCAGSVVVVTQVDENFECEQRCYQTTSRPSGSSFATSRDSNASSPLAIRRQRLDSRSNTRPVDSGDTSIKPRSAECVTISPNGDYLAVGEAGASPRVLLFSLRSDASNAPIATASDHSFGIKCLKFSPDSRFLMSVGDIHDGSIYLWSVATRHGAMSLHSRNNTKTIVHQSTWMGNDFVTVGTRNVRGWRADGLPSPTKIKHHEESKVATPISSPAPRALRNKNALLGDLLNSNFTTIQAVSDCYAVVGSDRGNVCLLTSESSTLRLEKMFQLENDTLLCSSIDQKERLWIACQTGAIWSIPVAQIRVNAGQGSWQRFGTTLPYSPVSFANFSSNWVVLDRQRNIRIYGSSIEQSGPILDRVCNEILSHSAPIAGLQRLSSIYDPADFVSYDATGFVIFWSFSGIAIRSGTIFIEQLDSTNNELRILCPLNVNGMFLAGDADGVLRLVNRTLDICHRCKAHEYDVNDIVVKHIGTNRSIIASASRDRTIQISHLENDGFEIDQTLDHHASSVNQLAFLEKHNTLLSLSADRTVLIYSFVQKDSSLVFIVTQTLTFKHTPTSMIIDSSPSTPDLLNVATADKQIFYYAAVSGQMINQVHVTDESGSPVTIDLLAVFQQDIDNKVYSTLIGVSADKCMRIFNRDDGTTSTNNNGHSDRVTGCLQSSGHSSTASIVTCSMDGSIMLWLASSLPSHNHNSSPLRNIIPKSLSVDLASSFRSSSPSTRTRSLSPIKRTGGSLAKHLKGSLPKASSPIHGNFLHSEIGLNDPFEDKMNETLSKSTRSTMNTRSFINDSRSSSKIIQDLRGLKNQLQSSLEHNVYSDETVSEIQDELEAILVVIGTHSSKAASKENLKDEGLLK